MDQRAFDLMLDGLTKLNAFADGFLEQSGPEPTPGSPADAERITAADPGAISNAWSAGHLLLVHGSDHVAAVTKLLAGTVALTTVYTCVRSMLEACAIAAWLLDPKIDSRARTSRVFAYRFEGVDQLRKFAANSGLPATELTRVENRLTHIEDAATALGFASFRDKSGRLTGIAERNPPATQLIREVLDQESLYRLLSSVAHGHQWPMINLGYEKVEPSTLGGVPATSLRRHANVDAITWLCQSTLLAFARPLWNQCAYFGQDALQLEEAIETSADMLGVTTRLRFWRS